MKKTSNDMIWLNLHVTRPFLPRDISIRLRHLRAELTSQSGFLGKTSTFSEMIWACNLAYKYYLQSPGLSRETFYEIGLTFIVIDGINCYSHFIIFYWQQMLQIMIHRMIRTNEPAQRSSIFSIFSWKISRSFTLSGLLLKIRPWL